jgi:hypothetical protein
MFIANAFDDNKKVNGQWVDFCGARFKIASQRSEKYIAAINRLMKPYTKQIKNNTLSPEQNETLLCAAMAEGLLLDWEGVGRIDESTGEAVEMKYSVENAKTVLKENYELREFVAEYSEQLDNFKRESVEDTVKK